MLQIFGIYGACVGFVLVAWFFHVGFIVKKVLKEQQETNKLLQQLANGGVSKAA